PCAPYRPAPDDGSLPSMSATKWFPRPARARRRHALAIGLPAAAMAGVTACEGGAGIGSAAVAFTTDQAATDELNQRKTSVRWLTCTASFGDRKGATPSANENSVATVDCQGETQDGKEITVTGRITHAVNGACVRGNVTAKVDGKQVFRV